MSNISDFIGGAPSVWVTGTTYSLGKVVLSPTDFQCYVRKVTGAGSTDPSADAINWQITGNAIKSIQRGVISVTTTTATITITAVNPIKTELRMLGQTSGSSDTTGLVQIILTNATTITANKAGTGVTANASWELTERY